MFIALKGIDGSGKATTADQVVRHLAAAGRPVLRVNKKAPPFTGPLVEQHMTGLRRLLWPADHRSTEHPFRRAGELHWIYLMTHPAGEVGNGATSQARHRGFLEHQQALLATCTSSPTSTTGSA